MPEPDLTLLAEAAQAAGEIALRYWRAEPKIWEKPGLGPVTEADLEANDLLQSRLIGARPDYGWLSEESADTAARLECERVFIVDPIDGTRAFIAGEKHFAVSLAIAERGQVTAAAIFLPALDQLYTASLSAPSLRNGQNVRCAAKTDLDGANMLMSKGILSTDHWQGAAPDLRRSFRPSIAYRLCLVADGSFDGMISLRDAWEWDIAAGALIARQAGAEVSDKHGAALRFNNPSARTAGIFCAAPGVHSALLTQMKI